MSSRRAPRETRKESSVLPAIIINPDKHLYLPTGQYCWTTARVKDAWTVAMADYESALPYVDRVVLVVGMAGAGKSTWVEENKQPGTLYFDTAVTTLRSLHKLLEPAVRRGKPVTVYWLDTPLQICLERNATRTPDRQVPPERLVEMALRLQAEPLTDLPTQVGVKVQRLRDY